MIYVHIHTAQQAAVCFGGCLSRSLAQQHAACRVRDLNAIGSRNATPTSVHAGAAFAGCAELCAHRTAHKQRLFASHIAPGEWRIMFIYLFLIMMRIININNARAHAQMARERAHQNGLCSCGAVRPMVKRKPNGGRSQGKERTCACTHWIEIYACRTRPPLQNPGSIPFESA